MNPLNPVDRFSHRADDYARYRPGYPAELLDVLEAAGLRPGSLVADIGAGTGISTELFRARDHRVIAIEPNADMRAAALIRGHDSRPGTGEATGLQDASVDLVFCAQAFHWLNARAAAAEFTRISRHGGLIGVVWNQRVTQGSRFAEDLESLLLTASPEYVRKVKVETDRALTDVQRVFAPAHVHAWHAPNSQSLDWPALRGRLLSASYVPLEGTPGHVEFVSGLRRLLRKDKLRRHG